MFFIRKAPDLALIPVIFWMLMQVLTLVSLTQSAAASVVAVQASDDQAPIEIVICTPTGFKTVTLGADDEIPEYAGAPSDCRWCQIWQTEYDIVAAHGSAIVVHEQSHAAQACFQNSYAPGIDYVAALDIRGPPVL